MRATLLLCDHVAEANGKLYINGAGWTTISPAPVPFGLAVLLGVPWDRANVSMIITLKLETEDGAPVLQDTLDGQRAPVQVQAQLEVGRPPGLRHGTELNVPLAIQLPGLALAADTGYTWRLMVGDETAPDWVLNFRTYPAS